MAVNYYDDSTAILTAYLGCAAEKRIAFVRETITTDDHELDLNKVWKVIDAILLNVEKARGQLASQLALASCTTASPVQMTLFSTTGHAQRLPLLFEERSVADVQ